MKKIIATTIATTAIAMTTPAHAGFFDFLFEGATVTPVEKEERTGGITIKSGQVLTTGADGKQVIADAGSTASAQRNLEKDGYHIAGGTLFIAVDGYDTIEIAMNTLTGKSKADAAEIVTEAVTAGVMAQATINAYVASGLSEQEAIARYEEQAKAEADALDAYNAEHHAEHVANQRANAARNAEAEAQAQLAAAEARVAEAAASGSQAALEAAWAAAEAAADAAAAAGAAAQAANEALDAVAAATEAANAVAAAEVAKTAAQQIANNATEAWKAAAAAHPEGEAGLKAACGCNGPQQ